MRRFKHVKSIPTALYCQAECIPIALCLAELVAPLHPRRPYGKHAVRHVWGLLDWRSVEVNANFLEVKTARGHL